MKYGEMMEIVQRKSAVTPEERMEWFNAMIELTRSTRNNSERPGSLKQKAWVFKRYAVGMPCPLCGERVSIYQAVPPGENMIAETGRRYECPDCGIRLEDVVPFVNMGGPGWHWRIHDETRERLLSLWKEQR